MEKIYELITKKLVGDLTALPFLASFIALGSVYYVTNFEQAAAAALAFLGVAGTAEIIISKRKTEFAQACQEFNALQCRDGVTFLKFTEHVFGRKALQRLDTKDVAVHGLVFREITTREPSFMRSIAGPLCPKCGKNVSYELLPVTARVRYTCLCGFKTVLKKDPKTLYMEVRRHFNLPR